MVLLLLAYYGSLLGGTRICWIFCFC